MSSIALPAVAEVASMFLPLLFVCAAAGWVGLAWLAWRATVHNTRLPHAVFILYGPLGGVAIWSCAHGDGGSGDDPAADDDGQPPEWDWDRFARDLADYQATIRPPVRAGSRTPRA